ncbi:MAG: hypothetical protein D0528_00840, partial [Methylococcales bacterium]
AGIDVHRMLHVITVLVENEDGTLTKHQQSFGGFKRDMKAMVLWLLELEVERVVMESTGIYWKSAYSHLERAGIFAMVVNAHFIKHVPGRKTDMCDSEWLAVLARFGLVRGSFIPPKDLRELRLVSRYRRKLSAMLASETNRLHKTLDDAGIKLGAVVSDIKGVSAREMVAGLIAGKARKGNAIVRYILCECANAARNTKSSLAAKYRSLMARKSHKKAIVAIAHKLIRIIYFMLSRHELYCDLGVDYEVMSAQKNAPRWIKALKKIGKLPVTKPALA